MSRLRADKSASIDVSHVCRRFGVSKQSYYKRGETKFVRMAQEKFVIDFVREVRRRDPGMCGRPLWHMYRREFLGTQSMVGRDRFESIIDEHGLKVRQKRRKPRTTDSRHGYLVYPDLVKNIIPSRVNQIWASDITYIPLHCDDLHADYRFCYLSMTLDLYSKEIVGYSVGDSLESVYPIEALKMALKRIEGTDGRLIHHSDRGVQYASHAYSNLLRSHGIRISMTEGGDPKGNAQAERINNTMKNELLYGMDFSSIEQVREVVKQAVEFYNNERPHMSLDMMTPSEAALCEGEIRKRWTSFREKHIKNGEFS